MNKVNQSVSRLISRILTQISEDHQIEVEALQTSVDKIIQPEESKKRCQGLVASKGYKPLCTACPLPGSLYCKRHMFNGCVPEETTTTQCQMITKNGERCMKNACANSTFCGVHVFFNSLQQRKQLTSTPCVYYDDQEGEEYCKKEVHENGWFCVKHKHLNKLYTKTYKYNNLKEYTNAVQDNTVIKRYKVLDLFICENGHWIEDRSPFKTIPDQV